MYAAAAAAIAATAAAVYWRLAALQAALADATARRNRLALDLMSTRNSRMHSAESVRVGRSFTPRRDDVFVVTYPKCGTTWVTQIVHALRTNASMDFGEITEVVPWDILAHDCRQDLDADQVASPRVFKSHEAWRDVAKGGRYVYVARNPLDAFFSFFKIRFHFFRSALSIDSPNFFMAVYFFRNCFASFWISWPTRISCFWYLRRT